MANEHIEQLISKMRSDGPREFAAWDADAFDDFLTGPVDTLKRTLAWRDKDEPDDQVIGNYLRLVFAGIGAGWLRSQANDAPPVTFLSHMAWSIVPYGLGRLARADRGPTMQLIWNLGEGLAREPKWLNQLAITQTNWSVELMELDKHLTDVLAPVVSPQPNAEWTGRCAVQTLDLRQQSPAFVPGKMYLASPAVLCIEDRDQNETLAVLLQKKGQSRVLGSVGDLSAYVESFERPHIELTSDAIVVNQLTVPTPLIDSPREMVVVASGFVAVNADDSQRLWLVESP